MTKIIYRIPMSVNEAMRARDSLAKSIYKQLFSLLVRIMNAKPESDTMQYIGILDIAGFGLLLNDLCCAACYD